MIFILLGVAAGFPWNALLSSTDFYDEQITINPDGKTCEFAIVVGDAWQKHGIGSALMKGLMEAARGQGLRAIEGEILADNRPMLELMEIIDTPGNSDPNMAVETWQRMLEFADAVIWCTNATQAWRQSEAAVWDEMPLELQGARLLGSKCCECVNALCLNLQHATPFQRLENGATASRGSQ